MSRHLGDLVFVDGADDNWFHAKYYYGGANHRYFTFQCALNLLYQRGTDPVLVETGCQRFREDIGAGMSTSIFGEYCIRHGGTLYTVDVTKECLDACRIFTAPYAPAINYVLSDSAAWLESHAAMGTDLLYLDSMDYPYGEILARLGSASGGLAAESRLAGMGQSAVLEEFGDLILPCQEHCLLELTAASRSGLLTDQTIVLLDDNQLPGGGKPRLAKQWLAKNSWTCLLDFQQTLWIKF